MDTPISDAYRTSTRPSFAPAPSPPLVAWATRRQHQQRLSVRPTDDPFASSSDLGMATTPLGGEEWRISEESTASTAGEMENGAAGRKLKLERRPSFLKSMLSTRRSRSSSSLSTANGRSISNPLSHSDPPRIAPLRTSASLIAFPPRDSYSSSASANPDATTTSLPIIRPTIVRDDDPVVPRRQSEQFSPADFAVPPTSSGKAFSLLGGPRITPANQKAVEKLTGVRTSLYTEDDRLAGLGEAMTTDAPTRYIQPENRLRVALSSSTGPSIARTSFSDGRARETVHSGYGSVLSVPEEDEYDPAQEDGDAISLGGGGVEDRLRRQASFPPPTGPIPPLPTISVSDLEARRRKISTSTNATTRTSRTAPDAPPVPPSWMPVSSPYNRTKGPESTSWLRRRASKTRSTSSLPLASKASQPIGGPVKTIGCVYMVAGLPKDPATWTLSDHADSGALPPAHSANAVPRFWRPEILGCSATGETGPDVEEMASLDGERVKRAKGSKTYKKSPPAVDPGPPSVILSKEDISRIQSKAMKLAFNRDVEIISSTTQPASSLATFCFTVSTAQTTKTPDLAGATAAAWDTALDPIASATVASEQTYYASSLLVWSHADASRSEAIRKTLQGGAKAKSEAIHRAVKAASAGKRLGARLAKQMTSPMGALPREGREWGAGGDTTSDAETEGGFLTESEWGDTAATAAPLAPSAGSQPLWLPFALVLVSQIPLYNLLSDVLRISWARYHQDFSLHSLHMRQILNLHAPRPGEMVKLPVSAGAEQATTHFVAKMPGAIDWATAQTMDLNVAVWPIFRALDADNLLSIAEVALSPMGRVLFISSFPVMGGIATSVFQHILEQRGWRGLVHATVHARDLRIYVEDPGPWLIAVPSQSRFIALGDLPPEVAVVDLDSNSVRIQRPHPGALSTGTTREKARKRLSDAIGNVSAYYTTPAELMEAFPAGRFRPFSEVEVDGLPKEAERLRPAASWDWNQNRTLFEFDAILKEAPRPSLIAKIFRTKPARKLVGLDASALHVQSIVRRHATTFVDRRDLLENRINRLNSKLSQLMGQSAEWQKSLDVFQAFSDKLTKESLDLKTRLEKERREARRLTGQVGLEKVRQDKLEASLRATDSAREQALEQLAEVQAIRAALEQQKNILMSEMNAVLSADETSPLYEAVYSRLDAISHRSDTSSRPGTSHSVRSSGSRYFRPSPAAFHEEDEREDELVTEYTSEPEEARLDQLKQAVHAAFESIQSRLAITLHNAEQFEPSALENTRSIPSPLPATALPNGTQPDTPPPSATTSPDPATIDGFDTVAPNFPEPHRFKPKPFRLTPPVSPENMDTTPQSFAPSRTSMDSVGRRMSRQSRHKQSDSVVSAFSYRSDSQDTPTTARPTGHFPLRRQVEAQDGPRPASANSFGVPRDHSYDTSDDADSFVSFDEGTFGSPESTGSFSDDDDATEGQSTATHESTSTGRHSSGYVRNESPVEGSVELFTRTTSIRRRSGLLGALMEEPKASRPVSSVTVRGP